MRDEPATFGDLGVHEVRVLGCLVEKESTTPASYPLTRNALRSACNQATSRDPVLDLSDQDVESALLALRDRRLARPVRNPGDRVTKFRHAMPEVWELGAGETAVLAVLLLRGAQTMGELRSRTARLHHFPDVVDVGEVLAALAGREPAMVAELARAPGQKETRWIHRAGVHEPADAVATASHATDQARRRAPGPDAVRVANSPAPSAGPSGTGGTMAAQVIATAHAVVQALADPRVAATWDEPSVLAGQTVSGLAGHLARGGVWVIADYLDRARPEGAPDFDDAAAYIVGIVDALDDDDHAAIRERGSAVAAVGHDHLVHTLRRRLADLEVRLATEDPDGLVAVYGGLSIRLQDYLATRIVEQVVHLDDLVRSVDGLEVALPPSSVEVAERVGMDALRRRHGPETVLRVLFRHEYQDRVPVL